MGTAVRISSARYPGGSSPRPSSARPSAGSANPSSHPGSDRERISTCPRSGHSVTPVFRVTIKAGDAQRSSKGTPTTFRASSCHQPRCGPVFSCSRRLRGVQEGVQKTPLISVPPRPTPDINRPSGPFRPDFPANNLPPESSAPSFNSPKPGEFTSFFQGPFRGDRPSEVPVLSSSSPSLPQEPPRKNVGDFTAMFGSVKQQPEEPPPSKGMAGNEPAGTGFTGWFTPEAPSRTSSTTVPPSTGLPRASGDSGPIFPEPSKEPTVPPPPVSYVAPAPPIFPAPLPPIPPVPKPPAATPSALAPGGATHAFSPSVSEPAPVAPPPPSGPSAYTEIISVKAMNPPADPAGAPKESAAKSAAPPGFAAPPLPVFAMPRLRRPMPKIAAPAPPKAPKRSESGDSGAAASLLLAAGSDPDSDFLYCRSAGAVLRSEALTERCAGRILNHIGHEVSRMLIADRRHSRCLRVLLVSNQ